MLFIKSKTNSKIQFFYSTYIFNHLLVYVFLRLDNEKFYIFRTMGTSISEMNASKGFCVEWVASVIVLIGTVLGLPLSTTHCKVGGVIGAGLAQGLIETNSPKMALKYVNFKVLTGYFLNYVLFKNGNSSISHTNKPS